MYRPGRFTALVALAGLATVVACSPGAPAAPPPATPAPATLAPKAAAATPTPLASPAASPAAGPARGTSLQAPSVSPAMQQAAETFYRGKTVRIIVGYDPGGGFDQIARLIQRHLSRLLPGNPTVIVENMPGAGSRVAANYLYRTAAPDGLTFATFNELQPLQQALGESNIEFDARKFSWIGSAAASTPVCIVRRETGARSMRDLLARTEPLVFGGLAPGSNPSDLPVLLKELTGARVRVANGYKGTADVARGIEAGELAGGCWPWESIASNQKALLDSGQVTVVVQFGSQRHPELPDVPLATDFVTSAEGRSMLQAFGGPNEISKPFAAPPGLPEERLRVLQKAFIDVMTDPAFLADAQQARVELAPKSGEQVRQVVDTILSLEPGTARKLAGMLTGQ